MSRLYRVYLVCAYYLALMVFLLVSLCVNLICFICCRVPGTGSILKTPLRALLQFLFSAWSGLLGFLRLLDLRTPEKTPWKTEKGEIWVMNHPTILDGAYLLKFISNGTCIYKHEIESNLFYGSTAQLADYIPNVGGPDTVRLACEALERGEDLVVFPEGTRSTKINLNNFKPGFALIAKRCKAPINVMWLECPEDFMTREAGLWKVPHLTARVQIDRIGRIETASLKSVSEIVEAVNQCYREKGTEQCA